MDQEDEISRPLQQRRQENEEDNEQLSETLRSTLEREENGCLSMTPSEMKDLVKHDQMENYRKRFENLKSTQEERNIAIQAIILQEHDVIRSALRNVEQAFTSPPQSYDKEPHCMIHELQQQAEHQRKDCELQIVRAKLQEKDEELKSLRNRISKQVAPLLETGNTINLNNPVSKPRLKELYDELCFDSKKLKKFDKKKFKPDKVKGLIKDEFQKASENMRIMKADMDTKLRLNDPKSGQVSSKVEKYKQLAIHNLQLYLYSEKFEAESQNPSSAHDDKKDVEVLESLTSKCYWMGCLLALNNPPLEPDWDNPPKSEQKWDIFPQDFHEIYYL